MVSTVSCDLASSSSNLLDLIFTELKMKKLVQKHTREFKCKKCIYVGDISDPKLILIYCDLDLDEIFDRNHKLTIIGFICPECEVENAC